MALRSIVTVQDDNPVLRSRAKPVRSVTGRVRALMDDMLETMHAAPGIGLAAPQVDVGLRVIVMEAPADLYDPGAGVQQRALANPEIVWAADEVVEGQEACLSIPDLYGDVPRAVAVRVQGLDRDGNPVEIDARDFEARVLQHEIDHLDGILFTDRVTSLNKLYHIRENEAGEFERVPLAIPTV